LRHSLVSYSGETGGVGGVGGGQQTFNGQYLGGEGRRVVLHGRQFLLHINTDSSEYTHGRF